MTTVTNPLGNVVTAQLDYRMLGPWEVTDPLDRMEDDRGNVMEVSYAAENLDNIPNTDWTSASQGTGLFPERPPALNGEYSQKPVRTKT